MARAATEAPEASPNLGLKYQRSILYDPEDGPGKDIVAAVDAIRARGIVDDRASRSAAGHTVES